MFQESAIKLNELQRITILKQGLHCCVFYWPGTQWQHRIWWCEHEVFWETEAGGSPMSAWAPETTSQSSSYLSCTATASPEEHSTEAVVQWWERPVDSAGLISPELRVPLLVFLFICFLRRRWHINLLVLHVSTGVQDWSAQGNYSQHRRVSLLRLHSHESLNRR